MAKPAVIFFVFVLPILFSFIFGMIVLAGILSQPDRELNFWQGKTMLYIDIIYYSINLL